MHAFLHKFQLRLSPFRWYCSGKDISGEIADSNKNKLNVVLISDSRPNTVFHQWKVFLHGLNVRQLSKRSRKDTSQLLHLPKTSKQDISAKLDYVVKTCCNIYQKCTYIYAHLHTIELLLTRYISYVPFILYLSFLCLLIYEKY